MSVQFHEDAYQVLDAETLAQWRGIAPAEASDCLDRGQALCGAISPLDPSSVLLGQARTVSCMVADNSTLHAALTLAQPGEVLVVNAQGFEDVAIWGGLMSRAAMAKGIAGIVLDGAVRDRNEIVELGFPCFVRAVVPRGPHKGFGGIIDAPISCGGVSVSPGDLILGDGDGVTVVPFGRLSETLTAAQELHARENETARNLDQGGTMADVYGVPEIIRISPK